MSATPAPGRLHAPRGLLGTLRSWLQGGSGEFGQANEGLPTEPARPHADFYGSARVLVVDDDLVNLMVISALMESRGIVPLLAADGGEAVALACELHFDLILMDLQMPILDGLRATSAIRRFEAQGSRPPVPVLAYSSTAVAADTLAAHGLNGSLAKPCGAHELEACLVRWCPTYRAPSTARGTAHISGGWQPSLR
ncbi:MAG: response regulator [Rhizobacter sp.]|nr:response regulator [Rhizobacter sp.]